MTETKRWPTSLVLAAYTGMAVHNPEEVLPFARWLLNDEEVDFQTRDIGFRVANAIGWQHPEFLAVDPSWANPMDWTGWLSHYELVFDTVVELTQLSPPPEISAQEVRVKNVN